MYTAQPIGARGVSGWLDDVLHQVAQAGADYVTQEATGVPTYGGAPSYPGAGGTYTPEPPPVILAEPRSSWLMPAAAVGGALIGAKLLGLF